MLIKHFGLLTELWEVNTHRRRRQKKTHDEMRNKSKRFGTTISINFIFYLSLSSSTLIWIFYKWNRKVFDGGKLLFVERRRWQREKKCNHVWIWKQKKISSIFARLKTTKAKTHCFLLFFVWRFFSTLSISKIQACTHPYTHSFSFIYVRKIKIAGTHYSFASIVFFSCLKNIYNRDQLS